MGIYIKGMEMPSKGFVDVRIFADGRATTATGEDPFYREMEVIELPPHGRLIDADALMLIILDYIEEYDGVDGNGYHDLKWCAMKEAEMAINDAPTIIKAEVTE